MRRRGWGPPSWIALAVVAVLGAGFPAMALPRGADGRALIEASQAIAALRLDRARRLLEPLARRRDPDPDVLAQWALLLFHEARYDAALTAMERAADAAPRHRGELLALMRASREATAGFVESSSPDGRYVVAHAPGIDAVLVPWALEALAAADAAISSELGARGPTPIRLEIFPSPTALASVSALSVEDIERTGTIALAKWDRLMITSPRALLRGYPWLDTVAHELTHLLLARASRDRAPVWLQEGVAKFLERRWREADPGAALDPASAALLASALREDRLLSFDDLHPSIARLPSQRDAALAFAQVATFVERFHADHGGEGLRRAVALVADGEDARDALADVAGTRFATLEDRWRSALRDLEAPDDAPALRTLRFGEGPSKADEAQEVEVEQARGHLRLGDLLWDRGRPAAASAEYGKAHRLAPDDPIVGARYARAAVEAGRPRQALEALAPLLARHPEHAPIQALSGRAHLEAGARGPAVEAFVRAIRLNPFDPAPHCGLAQATDDAALRRRAADACRRLGSHAGR